MNTADPNIARETVTNPKRNVVVVGLVRPDKQILLVRTKRLPDHWQPIGGGVKSKDRSLLDAVLRELKEEAGLALDPGDLRFEIATPYDFGEGQVTFYSTAVPPDVRLEFDESELAEWAWHRLQDALELPTFPATRVFLAHLRDRFDSVDAAV